MTLFDTMLGKQVDGIVLMSDHVTPKLLQSMEHSPVPIVLAGSVLNQKSLHLLILTILSIL